MPRVVSCSTVRALLFSVMVSIAVAAGIAAPQNDLSIHQFTEVGEVAQISYASRAVDKSKIAVVSFESQESTVLISLRSRISKLQITDMSDKTIEEFSPSAIVAMVGYTPDCEYTRSQCNLVKNSHMLSFGEFPSLEYMQRALSKWMTRGLYRGGDRSSEDSGDNLSRPLAVSIIFAGYDKSISRMKTSLVDNTGMYRSCRFATLGSLPGGVSTVERLREVLLQQEQCLGGGEGDIQVLGDYDAAGSEKIPTAATTTVSLVARIRKAAQIIWDEDESDLASVSVSIPRSTADRLRVTRTDPSVTAPPPSNNIDKAADNNSSSSPSSDIEVECCVVNKEGIRRTGWRSSVSSLVAAAERMMLPHC